MNRNTTVSNLPYFQIYGICSEPTDSSCKAVVPLLFAKNVSISEVVICCSNLPNMTGN